MIRDDFAGPGGWSEALKALGERERGIEFDRAACLTARAAGHRRSRVDVCRVRSARMQLAGYIASAPCQPFSAAGKGAGTARMSEIQLAAKFVTEGDTPEEALGKIDATGMDERSKLVLEPLYVIQQHRPNWIALEQVPTILPLWETYADLLTQFGYEVKVGNMHAEQYGVPQTRKRAILMASFSGFNWPEPTHSLYYPRNPTRLDADVLPWVSMAEALGWDEDTVIRSNYGTGGDSTLRGERLASQPSATMTSKVGRNVVYRASVMPNASIRPLDHPAPTVAFGHDAASVHWAFRCPATTIVGFYKPEIIAAPGYRTTVSRQNAEGSVRVTVEEAGVLQSFRPDYPWRGSKTKQYQQVGNAIPPLLARAILKELL